MYQNQHTFSRGPHFVSSNGAAAGNHCRLEMSKRLSQNHSILALTGCGKQNTNPQTPPANASGSSNFSGSSVSGGASSAPRETGGQTVQSGSLTAVADLLGKSDADVKDLFNGGTKNRTEDGSTLLGRSYTTSLDGTPVTLETVYAEDQTVSSVSASFTDKTPEEVKSIMTAVFGEPRVADETQAMDSKTLTWTKD